MAYCAGMKVGGATHTHLQLLVVHLATAVGLLGHVLVGVEEQTDAAVKAQLDVFHTCRQARDQGQRLVHAGIASIPSFCCHQWSIGTSVTSS